MNAILVRSVLALLVVAAVAWESDAQTPPRPQQPPAPAAPYRPPVSPYLNLLNRQTSPAVNYYGIVRPQVQFGQAIQQQQSELNQLRQQNNLGQLRQDIDQLPARLKQDLAVAQPLAMPIPTFVNYSHYYAMPQGRR